MNLLLVILAALHQQAVRNNPVCPNVPPGDPAGPAPVFLRSSYSFPMFANNLPLGKVSAHSSWTSQIWYSLVGTDDVSIDSMSGELRVRSPTRPDRLPYQTFFAVATDPRRQSSTATVKVNFTRIDYVPVNRPPIFSSQQYRIQVSPNTEPGAPVYTVYASGPIGKSVIYSLQNSTYFTVDKYTGEIKLYRRLPNVPSLSFIVSAQFELESSLASQSYVYVKVAVSSPVNLTFPNSWNTVDVPSNIGRGHRVQTLKAVTQDISQQGFVQYSMSGSDALRIDSITGEVTVARLPLLNSTAVRVIASLGPESTYTILTIRKVCPLGVTLRDCPVDPCLKPNGAAPACQALVNASCVVNNCGECFAEFFKNGDRMNCTGPLANKPLNKAIHEVYIFEEGPLNSVIVDLYELGRGSLYPLGPELNFSLEDSFDGTFAISQSGKISNLKRFDFDNGKRYYDLIASVLKSTPVSMSAMNILISVNVMNINDNSPLFTPTLPQLTLSTSLNDGDTVYKANAVDLDKGDKLSYAIIGGDVFNVFQMERETGIISLARPLQHGETFTLTLEASDSQTPEMSTTMSLEVLPEDPAPGRPVFPYRFNTFRLTENTGSFSLIKTIPASGGTITYGILNETNKDGMFHVDYNPNLLVTTVLDRESVQSGYCVLTGTDQSSGITSYVQIFLEVVDENDNIPRWPFRNFYRVDLHQNTAVGTEVFREKARDMDLNPNITYSITGDRFVELSSVFTVSSEANEVVIRLREYLPTGVSYIPLMVFASDGLFTESTYLRIYVGLY